MALKRTDRCDVCGAQALYQAYFWIECLLFCGHHYNKHKEALDVQGLAVADQNGDLIW